MRLRRKDRRDTKNQQDTSVKLAHSLFWGKKKLDSGRQMRKLRYTHFSSPRSSDKQNQFSLFLYSSDKLEPILLLSYLALAHAHLICHQLSLREG